MPNYKARQNADTWMSYLGGILSNKTTIVKAGEEIVADDLGSVLKLSDGRYTKEMWFELMPVSNPPPSPTVPVPVEMDITLTKGSIIVVKDSLGKTVFSYTAP